MVKSEPDKKKPKKENINKNIAKKALSKTKVIYTKCLYEKCNGKNCGIRNILSSYILVKEIINDKIRIFPAHLSYHTRGFEVIVPNGLNRQMSCDKTLYFRELIENMSPSDKEDVKTKEEFLASVHN